MSQASRYRPRILIGRGGMGEVWLGTLEGPEGFRRAVVMKRARADQPEGRQALIDEAHVASVVSHHNVVHIHELVKTQDGLVLAMEYLTGLSVRALLRRLALDDVRVPPAIAARIAADAARGLHAAHVAVDLAGTPLAIVHRDVSPENLVTTEAGITKVLDFGIARSRLRTATVAPTVKGKLAYLSPEQVRGESLDARSDAFALGSVLYELLAGVAPFRHEDALSTVEAITAAIVPGLPDEVPTALASVLRRLLARRREDRPRTLAETADELEAIAGREGRHGDVALFLRAEAADALRLGHERLHALAPAEPDALATVVTRVTVLHPLAGTMASLDPDAGDTDLDMEETTLDELTNALALTRRKPVG